MKIENESYFPTDDLVPMLWIVCLASSLARLSNNNTSHADTFHSSSDWRDTPTNQVKG